MRISECKRSPWPWSANLCAANFGGGAQEDRRASAEAEFRIVASPQWRDGRFRNRQPLWMSRVKAVASLFSRDPNHAPTAPVPIFEGTAGELAKPVDGDLRATWLGHSTVFLEVEGQCILIDPVWAKRASPVSFTGPRRWYRPPLPLDAVPALDAVLITHDHYDHLDRGAVVALAGRTKRFIVPLGVGARLRAWGVPEARITELDWWETVRLGRLNITATPARHAGGRGVLDRDATLWSGYVVAGVARRVYCSGDTGMMEAFDEIGARLGPFDLTLMEIGAYSQSWPDWHMGPEQAVEAHRRVGGRVMLPVHWGLFSLSTHAWTEPIERAAVAAREKGVVLATPRPGESISPAVSRPRIGARWWPSIPWRAADRYPIVSTRDGRPAGDPSGRERKTVDASKLEALRRELIDRAYEHDRRGEPAAADLASMVSARLDELIAGGE